MAIQQQEFETYRTLILSEQIEQRHVPQLLKDNPEFEQWYKAKIDRADDSTEATQEIIDEIERLRASNNANWINLLRLAFRVAPGEAKLLVRNIGDDDAKISELASKLGA